MNHFRAVQIFAGIPFFGGYFHRYLLQFVHNGSCFFDVFALGGFVAAAKQKNDLSILDGVISPEAGAKKNATQTGSRQGFYGLQSYPSECGQNG